MIVLLLMPLLWLASHPNNSALHTLFPPETNRYTLMLPHSHFVDALLGRLGIENSRGESRTSLPRRHIYLHALMEVSFLSAYHGPLTVWPNEADYLHEYLHHPLDAFAVEITDFVALDQPILVNLQILSHVRRNKIVNTTVGMAARGGKIQDRGLDLYRSISMTLQTIQSEGGHVLQLYSTDTSVKVQWALAMSPLSVWTCAFAS